MDIEAFTREVSHVAAAHPEWRYGQVLFNVLLDHDKALAEQVRCSWADPFYAETPNDERVAHFWAAVVARS